MKKVFAIVALIAAMFVAGNVQAQTTINFGYAPETISTTVPILGTSNENFQGFFVGATYNAPIAKGLGVAVGPELRFNMHNQDNVKSTQILLDVPILLNYEIAINRDLSITPFVGPMISFALVGNTKYNNHTDDWYDNSDYSRFNLNGVGGVSLGFQKFDLFLGYRMGLLDLYKNDNITVKTQGYFIGLGMDL